MRKSLGANCFPFLRSLTVCTEQLLSAANCLCVTQQLLDKSTVPQDELICKTQARRLQIFNRLISNSANTCRPYGSTCPLRGSLETPLLCRPSEGPVIPSRASAGKYCIPKACQIRHCWQPRAVETPSRKELLKSSWISFLGSVSSDFIGVACI